MDKFQQDKTREQFAKLTALLEDTSTLASTGQSHSINIKTTNALTKEIEAGLQKAHNHLASIKSLIDKSQ